MIKWAISAKKMMKLTWKSIHAQGWRKWQCEQNWEKSTTTVAGSDGRWQYNDEEDKKDFFLHIDDVSNSQGKVSMPSI